MNTQSISPAALDLLIEAFMTGNENGRTDETLVVLRAVRLFRPEAIDLVVPEAWQLIGKRHMPAARQLLESADAEAPGRPAIKALLATCLFLSGDGLWQAYLSEARALDPDKDVMAMINALEAMDNDGHRDFITQMYETVSPAY
jgi:thioredoxin-like negative regulator of GroEL